MEGGRINKPKASLSMLENSQMSKVAAEDDTNEPIAEVMTGIVITLNPLSEGIPLATPGHLKYKNEC